ncbi:S2-RNase [Pyrus ussuriensis x Pyrus communis]|uniref:S2-RNase n=1 Tax=Pyrus ussuriensis x Pyrus communis TaxID=2448454 RepID=A0A5N5ILB5_9ROSA|nr:S2-RNase [Pyrus ussuriensis x Pyrus communis]
MEFVSQFDPQGSNFGSMGVEEVAKSAAMGCYVAAAVVVGSTWHVVRAGADESTRCVRLGAEKEGQCWAWARTREAPTPLQVNWVARPFEPRAAHVMVGFDEQFKDFLEMFEHVIPSGVRVKRAKNGSSCELYGSRKAIKLHLYYFVLGFNVPMPQFFQEVICSMKCALTQCFPNVVRVIVGFHNLSGFFDLELIDNEFWYFFDIGHIDGVG